MTRRLFRSGHAYGEIRELLRGVEPKGLCLDLPAGKGVNWQGIRDAGFEPIEADLFPGRAGPDDAKRVKLDFNARLPFRDGAFAAVLCSEGIEHHPAQGELIAEFHRVLEPGGALLITTPNTLNLRARVSTLLNGHYSFNNAPISEATQLWRAPDGPGTFVGHAHMVGFFELRFLLWQRGFALREVTTAKYSGSAVALAPLLWLPVRWATARLCRKYLRGEPALRRELVSRATSPELMFGKKLIVLAQKHAARLTSAGCPNEDPRASKRSPA